MTQEDEKEFLDFVSSTGDVLVIPSWLAGPNPETVTGLPPYFSGDNWSTFWLFNRSISSRLQLRHVPQQQRHVVASDSSVIEFSRSHPKHGHDAVLQAGRIWAEFDYLTPHKRDFLGKEVEFQGWYEAIAKWVRKNFNRVAYNAYVGRGAQEQRRRGWKL